MIHIYKRGGGWKTKDGIDYDLKCVNNSELQMHLVDGWVRTIDELNIEDAVFEEVKPKQAKAKK